MALALRDWLRLVLQYADPWLSDTDIGAGDRWSLEVGKQLESSDFGVLCLTSENLLAPWIFFEAGALAKSLSTGVVCPYLLDVDFADIGGPLAQFQAKKADEKSTFELITAINNRAKSPVGEKVLGQLFRALWPSFERELTKIRKLSPIPQQRRHQVDVLEDLVSSIRRLDQRFDLVEESQEKVMAQLESASQKVDADIAGSHGELRTFLKSGQLANDRTAGMLRELGASIDGVRSTLNIFGVDAVNRTHQKLSPEGNAHAIVAPGPDSVTNGSSKSMSKPRKVFPFFPRSIIVRQLLGAAFGLLLVMLSTLIFLHYRTRVEAQLEGDPPSISASPASSTPTNTEGSQPPFPPELVKLASKSQSFRFVAERYGQGKDEFLSTIIATIIGETDVEPKRLLAEAERNGGDAFRSVIGRIQDKYNLRPDGMIGAETEILLLALALRNDPSSMEILKRSMLWDDKYKYAEYHKRAAERICGNGRAPAREVAAVISALYGPEMNIYECDLRADV